MISDYDICHSRYHYDPETGILRVKSWYSGISKKDIGKIVGRDNGSGYLQLRLNKKFQYVHRVIWLMQTGEWPEHEIDHINRIRTDNRWCNLREVTHQQNNFNREDSSPNLYITPHRNKLQVRVPIKGKTTYIGTYSTMVEALQARDEALKNG